MSLERVDLTKYVKHNDHRCRSMFLSCKIDAGAGHREGDRLEATLVEARVTVHAPYQKRIWEVKARVVDHSRSQILNN